MTLTYRPLIASRAEILMYMSRLSGAAALSESDLALLDMIHPMAESVLKSYIHSSLGQKQHIEYYPAADARGGCDDYPLDQYTVSGDRAVFNGGGGASSIIALRHTPVVYTGMEVREWPGAFAGQGTDPFPDSSVLTLGTDYWLDVDDEVTNYSTTGFLRRSSGSWSTEPRSIKVTYYGGFSLEDLASDIAGVIKLAALQTITSKFLECKAIGGTKGLGPLTAERLGDYSYAVSSKFLDSISLSTNLPVSVKALLEPFRNYNNCFG